MRADRPVDREERLVMRRRPIVSGAGWLMVAGLTLSAGCNTAGDEPIETATPTPAEARRVSIGGVTSVSWITPVGLYVDPGETVVFAVESGPHSSRAYHPDNGTELRIPEAADPWHSPAMGPGQSFSVTFSVPGTYDWYCATHRSSGRVGRIVAGGPGVPAEASPPPHGHLPDSERIVEQGAVSHQEMQAGG